MKQDLEVKNERRGSQRFKVSAPVIVIDDSCEISGYTRDLSDRGVYFYVSLADATLFDRDFQFVIELPPEVTLSTCCQIRCRGRAVRSEKASMDMTGIAAEILGYSIVREAASID
jgi:PilZ domain